jgi:hypothetical protein
LRTSGRPGGHAKASNRSKPAFAAVWAVLFAFAATVAGLAAPARAGDLDSAAFKADLQQLTSRPTRVVGSDGYYAAFGYVRSQIQALPGVELREHRYPVMVPKTVSAELTLPDGTTSPVYPFWPAGVRVSGTPAEGIKGKLVYCGRGQFESIPPADVRDNIAVVEAEGGDKWVNAFYFGARAVIVVGSGRESHIDLRSHELIIPANLPRFYVPAGPLADQLRANSIKGDATLKAQVVWERAQAVNLYALVLPTDPAAATGAAVTIAASVDSSGFVPDLAAGAGQAVQPAAALAMLRDYAKDRPTRPVLFAFTGADTLNFLGSRNLFLALAESPIKWRDELADRVDDDTQLGMDLARAKSLNDDPTQLDVAKDRSLIHRVVQVLEVDIALEQDQLFRIRLKAKPSDEEKARAKQLEERQIMLNQLKYALQKKPGELGPEGAFGDLPRTYLRRTVARMGGRGSSGDPSDPLEGLSQQYAARRAELELRINLYEWLAGKLGRKTDLRERDNNERLIEVFLTLDLSDRGVRVGPAFWGTYLRASSLSQIQTFRDFFNRIDPKGANAKPPEWFAKIKPLIDFEPLTQARSQQTYLATAMPLGSEQAGTWGVPGFSLITLDDARLFRDTPADTLANVNVDSVAMQATAVHSLLRNSLAEVQKDKDGKVIPDQRTGRPLWAFRAEPDFRRQRATFTGQVVSTAAGRPVPDLPRDGFLVTYTISNGGSRKVPQVRYLPFTLGVRRTEVRDCDAEGNYRFEGISRLGPGEELRYGLVRVYGVDRQSGAITLTSDIGRQSADLTQYADFRQDQNPLKSVVFNCQEFTLVNLYDPRYLQALGEVIPMDARRNAEPQRYDALLFNQVMAGFAEPGSRLLMLFRYGRIGNRLVLLNVGEKAGADDKPPGYTIQELNDLGPLALTTAEDFWRLDKARLEEYRRNGVSSGLLDQLHELAGKQIAAAEVNGKPALPEGQPAPAEDAGHPRNDAVALMRNATGAAATEARVYSAATAMANDVINAAIFLLLLCVPFSFCMERLLVASPSVYKQIAGIFVIFGVMTAALWTFHPAFKISSSPLIIILAFAIILMSAVVISVVYGKFDTELKKIRSGRGTAPSTSFARASVLASAIQLGIANMRRRKFRTALTSATVVLITFAVLCFTSSSRFLETTTLPTGVPTNGNHGVMLRQRGFRQMPVDVLATLRAALPGKQLVERWWVLNAGDPKDNVNLVAGGVPVNGKPAKIVAAAAVLGLSPGESAMSAIDDVIGPDKYARLENGETDVVYLSTQMATSLGVKEGDSVRVAGVDLKVAGLYDANEFEQRVLTLSGEPIGPLRYQSGMLDASGQKLTDVNDQSLDLNAATAGAEIDAAYEHLPPTQFVITHSEFARKLHNASLRSVGIKLANDAEVKQVADELTRRISLATFAGYDDGVSLVAASDLAQISGSQVAIPLAIGGLIIFNTMMGSIAERRREIHVYTSLGLAPLHVGALFVAEALTYGLIGAVFGYVIGQGVGTALLKLGWLGNVTLNYSGTSAMLTMGLILLVVLLSALVPARLASKIAAPSIDRTWKVPLPQGDQIIAQLPFTINKTAADGALGYLAEFFEAHQEGSIGKFSAGKVEPFTIPPQGDKPGSSGLKTVIWLTPFDLGVRQHLMLLIHPGEFPDIYEVQVLLQRLSGDDGSWYRMNRTFLTELRKQFLQWRSLSPQRMLQYVEDSRKLFHQVPEEVVTTAGGETVRLG